LAELLISFIVPRKNGGSYKRFQLKQIMDLLRDNEAVKAILIREIRRVAKKRYKDWSKKMVEQKND